MFGRPRIPRQYRAPRPTALSASRADSFVGSAAFELLVLLAALGILLWSPLQSLDDRVTAALLRMAEDSRAPRSSLVLRIAPSVEQLDVCRERLASVAHAGQAKALLFMPPAFALCAPEPSTASPANLPAAQWPDRCVHGDADGPLGFSCDAAGRAALQGLGIEVTRWVRPFRPPSVPSLTLEDLERGRVPLSTLRGRVLVVELAGDASPDARAAAAASASVLEGGTRQPASGLWVGLLAVLLAGSVVLTRRLWRGRAFAVALLLSLLVCAASYASARYDFLGPLGLLPLPRLLGAIAVALAIVHLPQHWANRRALRHAADLVERAALMRSDGIHTIPDAEFWSRVGDLAIQAHPADSVLVAELPAGKWHLKFWPYRGLGENIIRERRRDMRRTPYSNEAGTPEICVTRRYLAMEGTPAVIVPLIALGEVEGYLFFCGDKAERTYLRSPEIAQRLSQDLGLMLRRRRVAGLKEEKWRRPGGLALGGPAVDTAMLVEGAEIALGDLKMFGSLVRNAAIGLLYADAFGHVRILGSAFSEWLPRVGVNVPSAAAGAPLSPGALMLGTVLQALSDGDSPPLTLADVTASPQGKQFRVPLPGRDGESGKIMVLTVRALEESSDGVSWVAGYVGTLVEEAREAKRSEGGQTLQLPLERLTEVLSVRPLSEAIRSVVRAAAARSGKPVQFEPPREMAHAIAYHRELGEALEDLLFDAALRDSSGSGPVVTLSEEGDRIHIRVMDVQFGLPPSALRRALLAPSDPPEGLEAFGRFVFTVAESHGGVELQEDDWGITVVAKLLRARPLTRKPSLRPPRQRKPTLAG